MTTGELIARAKASLEGVTPGPFVYDEQLPGTVYSDDRSGSIVATCKGFEYAPRPEAEQIANARFFVSARQDVPDLIAALRAAEEALDHANACNRGLVRLNEVLQARAEQAKAMVAAAYRDAAQAADDHTPDRPLQSRATGMVISSDILARIPADAQAALDKLIREAERRGQAKAGAIFATSGAEARYVEDGENACPVCGGSGHKDDAQAALDRITAEAVDEALERAIVRFRAETGFDDDHPAIGAIRAMKGGA